MKIAIIGGAAFVLALAGGVGVRVMTAPPPAAVHASAEGDSTGSGAHGAHADSSGQGAAAAHAGETHAAVHEGAPKGASTTPAGAVSTSAAGGDAHARGSGPATSGTQAEPPPAARAISGEGLGQVSKILGNMKPAEAAKIMAYLHDDYVEAVLRSMAVRQAAAVLSQLPSERAAMLSRRLIEHPSGEES